MLNRMFACCLLALAPVIFSFQPAADHYSVDHLPASWKENKSLLRAIDQILSVTVKELSESTACENCKAPYYVDILIDSPIIIKQTVHEVNGTRQVDGFRYECVTEYAFKSSLAVYNDQQHGVSKVQITDPLKDDFRSTRKFNIEDAAAAKNPQQYAEEHADLTGPTQQDLLNHTEKKIYIVRDDVQKLIKRRL